MSDGKEVAGRAGKTWLPSAKKFGEFVLADFQMQRSLETLKSQSKQLQDEVSRLQRQVDEQAGQLKSIQSFVQTAVYEHVDRRAERAAMAVMQQFVRVGPEAE